MAINSIDDIEVGDILAWNSIDGVVIHKILHIIDYYDIYSKILYSTDSECNVGEELNTDITGLIHDNDRIINNIYNSKVGQLLWHS